ncbi:PilZ domain-containing protein [Pleomorphomonas koreensis]|uniref:PilZ domain-containing protein n=1 Tax=Pleomorphomonas koreensis TaxID=257440 RepID=UPI00047E3582|nr:PilZ domain-containing protein [Pleomorphomonas koreensis]
MATSQTSPDMQEILKNLRNPNIRVVDGRQHKRVLCFLLATVQHNKYTFECIVEDMSVGGCKVNNTDGLLTIGETVVINIPEQKMSLNGMVMWVRGKMAGLCFNLSSH